MFGSIWPQFIRPFFRTARLNVALEAQHAGIFSVIVDLEPAVQSLQNLEAVASQPAKIRELASILAIPVTVKLNQLGPRSADEVEQALDLGARILMLPRATHPAEVESFVDLVRGRAQTFIKIETDALAQRAADLAQVPWDYAHVDLVNLGLDQRRDWVLQPLMDGTVERICSRLAGRTFGFGTLSTIGERKPVEMLSLVREMARLHCSLGVLGHGFEQACAERNLALELKVMFAAFEAAVWRENQAIEADRQHFQEELAALMPMIATTRFPYLVSSTPAQIIPAGYGLP